MQNRTRPSPSRRVEGEKVDAQGQPDATRRDLVRSRSKRGKGQRQVKEGLGVWPGACGDGT
eukprot:3719685-Amphidinium_carterae.1